MKILVAPNAFKGSLSAGDAAHAMARELRSIYPGAVVIEMPLADGGSGTLDTLVETTLGEFIEGECANALGERIIAPFGVLGSGKQGNDFAARTGVVELAKVCGLQDIPIRKRNPLVTSTFGAGELLLHAAGEGCMKFIIGLGDTGTHDCGAGIAQAAGIHLLDSEGKEIGAGGAELQRLESIDSHGKSRILAASAVVAACDVSNPLTGKHNTAREYAPQKGANDDAVKILEEASTNFARVVKKDLGKDVSRLLYGGAAGGVGAGLTAFFDAELRSGAEIVLEYAHFDEACLDADFVVTGEGTIDAQTASGKTITAVCAHAKKMNVPVFAFAGMVDEHNEGLRTRIGLEKMYCITPDTATEEEAMKSARVFLSSRIRQVFASSAGGVRL